MSPESMNELSQSLRQLTVASPALDRDRLLFEAGRRSVRRSWGWPMATTVSLLLAGTCALLYLQQSMNHRQQAQRPAVDPAALATNHVQKSIPEVVEAVSPLSYLALREGGLNKNPVLPSISDDVKPMPILSAGSYVLPEWQRW
jgi:hypothetical protein